MLTMYRKDGKPCKVDSAQVKLMEKAGYSFKQPKIEKEETKAPHPSQTKK